MPDKNTYITAEQIDAALQRSFDAFFIRIDARIDAKLDAKLEVLALRMEDMVDRKIEQLATMTRRGFIEMREYMDGRFDSLEIRVANLESRVDALELSARFHR